MFIINIFANEMIKTLFKKLFLKYYKRLGMIKIYPI